MVVPFPELDGATPPERPAKCDMEFLTPRLYSFCCCCCCCLDDLVISALPELVAVDPLLRWRGEVDGVDVEEKDVEAPTALAEAVAARIPGEKGEMLERLFVSAEEGV